MINGCYFAHQKEFMNSGRKSEKAIRVSLDALLLLVALNAFGGGIYGLTGAKEIPTEWLEGSPFHSYFIPSLVLIVVVGGSSMVAAIFAITKNTLANASIIISAILLLIWILVQIVVIGYVSWLQPMMAAVAVFILLFNWILHHER